MQPALTKIFVTLGILFLFLILVGIYFYAADPMNLKPMIFGTDAPKTKTENSQTTTATGGFQLSEPQKQALIQAGIDPQRVPSSISATQETCFVGALGDARVAEIKSGAVPSAMEYLKTKACF